MIRTVISKAKILIVDDEQANVRLLERILELIGASRVVSTTDSREAMALFVDFRPDLVLLDLHMPNVNGFEIMEQIKVLSYEDHPVPVLVLTADITAKTKHRALAAGAKDFLTKPLDQSEVLLRIRNLLENRFLQIQQQNQNILLEEQVHERTAQLEDTLNKLRARAAGGHQAGAAQRAGHHGGGHRPRFQQHPDADPRLQRPDAFRHEGATRAARRRSTSASSPPPRRTPRRSCAGCASSTGRPTAQETRVSMQLNQLVEQAVTMTRPKWKDHAAGRGGAGVVSQTELGELPPIQGDPAELREMLTNLIFNAVDAMPNGGAITIRTRMENGLARLVRGGQRYGHGRGNPPALSGAVFHDQGRAWHRPGTFGGVRHHRAARRHDGDRQRKGPGDDVLHRPADRRRSITEGGTGEPVAEPAGGAGDGARTLRILVVDDQPIIRDVIQRQLVEDGHSVETAGKGVPRHWRSTGPECYDLMITDQSMGGGMSGEELAVEVKKICPGLADHLADRLRRRDARENASCRRGSRLCLGKPATQIELRRAMVQLAAK